MNAERIVPREDIPYRPCICGALWGLDFSTNHEVRCLCGETLSVLGSESTWHLQHGENPEHQSESYEGGNLLKACDWIDAVHGRSEKHAHLLGWAL